MRRAHSLNQLSAIDINLMPQREPYSGVLMLPILLILLAMGAFGTVGWLWYDAQSKLADVRQQLSEVSEASAALAAKVRQGGVFSGQWSDLLSQPSLLKARKPAATELLSQLNRMLPAHANVTQLELGEQGRLLLTLRLATPENIISFSQSMQTSERFKLLRMGTITKIAASAGEPAADSLQQPPGEAGGLKLPVYQATFELTYASNEEGGEPIG